MKKVKFHTHVKTTALLLCSTSTFVDLVPIITGNSHGTMRTRV